ncbi:mechanosensitive ion channel family protein [Moraxella sp. ZJ142]|uniref:mechanosensitive ion channel family protein n=1 Tax=Moraxella marmotae TaxID=3344520 RepID=UPI0035D425EE
MQFLGISIDVATLTQMAIDLSGRLLLALLIFFVGKWIGNRLVGLAKRIMARSHLDNTAANFLGNLLYGIMLVAVILASLNKLGVNTNSFVAVLGAAGVAIGVSLKDQLSNLAAGVLIVIFRPFGRGDYVEVGGKTGTVLDITLVNTRIRTTNNHEIIIPNGDIMTSASTNYTSLPTRRVDIEVGIGYEADIREARAVLVATAKAHPHVLADPEPSVVVTALADSSVNLLLRVWADNEHWYGVQTDLLEAVKYALDDAGINIPFPNRTIQIEGLDMDKLAKLLQAKAVADQSSKDKFAD